MKKLEYEELKKRINIEKFSEYSTLGALSSESLNFLLEKGVILELKKYDKLFEAGERSDSFYVILDGDVRFCCRAGNDRDIFQGRITTGMEVGATSMIALQPRWGSAYMQSNGIVLKIPMSLFHDLQIKYNEDFSILLINLMREVCRRFIRMSSLMGDVTLKNREIKLLNDSDRLL